MEKADIPFEKEKALPVRYHDVILDVGFRCDFLVDNRIIVECKSTREITEIDKAHVINYLKISDKQVGLQINFNVRLLKDGLQRLVNNYNEIE